MGARKGGGQLCRLTDRVMPFVPANPFDPEKGYQGFHSHHATGVEEHELNLCERSQPTRKQVQRGKNGRWPHVRKG